MYVHSLRHVMCVFTNKCRPKSTSDVYVFLGPLHGDANTDDLSPLVTYMYSWVHCMVMLTQTRPESTGDICIPGSTAW